MPKATHILFHLAVFVTAWSAGPMALLAMAFHDIVMIHNCIGIGSMSVNDTISDNSHICADSSNILLNLSSPASMACLH